MERRHFSHFGVLSLDAARAETFANMHAYCWCCDHIETPSFLMKIISPGSDVCLAHILEDPSSRGCIIACFDSLAQHGFAVPTCAAGTHRSSGIAEVVADWASRLLGPTLLTHSYSFPDDTSLQDTVSSVCGFVRESGPIATLPKPLLMGQPLDPATLPLPCSSAERAPDHYDARSVIPKGLGLLAEGLGLSQLRQAWEFCQNTAANTPGSLFRCVLASLDSDHAAPRPLPSPGVPQPPMPPQPARHRDATRTPEIVTQRGSVGPSHAALLLPVVPCDSGASQESEQACGPIQRSCVAANDSGVRQPTCGWSRLGSRTSLECRPGESRPGHPSRRRSSRGQRRRSRSRAQHSSHEPGMPAAPASLALWRAMQDAPDQAAWTLTNCSKVMTLAGIEDTLQKRYMDIVVPATRTGSAKTTHLIHWMRRLLSTLAGSDPYPIHNMPRWFQHTLGEYSGAAPGADGTQS